MLYDISRKEVMRASIMKTDASRKGEAMKRLILSLVIIALAMIVASSAFAVPRLQTYIVGSRYYSFYRQEFASWITNRADFDLKVVGYWDPARAHLGNAGMVGCKPGRSNYDYMDTWLMMSVPKNESGTVWINGIEITSFGNFRENLPVGLNPNPSLRWHMPAGIGQFAFQSLGRIDNDQINAYEYSYGRIRNPGWGDEILVNIVVSGYSWVHFDALGMDSRGKTYVNPYSHDASYYNATPEPGTLSLFGLGLLGLIPIFRRKKD